jgi:hypothetical protein
MNAISPAVLEHDPLKIDPRPCGECGLTIDRHQRVDTPEGPEFFCDDLETQIHLAAADLVKQWELADPRDRWRHTGEPPPKASAPNARPEPYRAPQSTVDAFKYVVSLNDADYLARWLANHPADAPELFKIWKSNNVSP